MVRKDYRGRTALVMCDPCNKSVTSNHMAAHRRTQTHRALVRKGVALRTEAELFFELVRPEWLTGAERLLYFWSRDGVIIEPRSN